MTSYIDDYVNLVKCHLGKCEGQFLKVSTNPSVGLGKITSTNMGKMAISEIGKHVASALGLKDPESYTGVSKF